MATKQQIKIRRYDNNHIVCSKESIAACLTELFFALCEGISSRTLARHFYLDVPGSPEIYDIHIAAKQHGFE